MTKAELDALPKLDKKTAQYLLEIFKWRISDEMCYQQSGLAYELTDEQIYATIKEYTDLNGEQWDKEYLDD